jgi:hypothetical protein
MYFATLSSFWPFTADYLEVITQGDKVAAANAALGTDRFGSSNSALSLNYGYIQVPNGVYFTSPTYTLMLWLKLDALPASGANSAFNFGNSDTSSAVIISIISFIRLVTTASAGA